MTKGGGDGDELERRLRSHIDNKARNRSRRIFRREKISQPLDDGFEQGAEEDPSAALDYQRALRQLPPKVQRVWQLADGGFTDREIADKLGIAPSTACARRTRAQQLLARFLGLYSGTND